MDWHLFSLLLSSALVWLGAVWSVLLVVAICLTLAVKRLIATFEANLGALGERTAERVTAYFGAKLPDWVPTASWRVWTMCLRADASLVQMAKARAHGFVSILLIVGLVVLVITSSAVVLGGVYREGDVMVSSCGTFAVDAVNQSETVAVFARKYLPSADNVSVYIEWGLNSSYAAGRHYLADVGKGVFGPSFNESTIDVVAEGLGRLWHLTSPNASAAAAAAAAAAGTLDSGVSTGHHHELPIERVVRLALAGDFTGAYDGIVEGVGEGSGGGDVLAAVSDFDFGLVSVYLHRGVQMLTQNMQVRVRNAKLVSERTFSHSREHARACTHIHTTSVS